MNKKLFITTKIICFLITGLLFNSVVGDDEINDNLKRIKNKQLSSLSSSLVKLKKNDGYIELKDPPILRVTPISLFDFDYKSSQENVYEEMDELLKLKRKSSLDNRNKKRGDMDPILDYSALEDKIDDIVPVRGDIVTRNKRSHSNYDYDDNDNDDDDDDDDYYYYYDNDNDNNQLWGFSESDGIDLINKDYYSNDKLVNEFKNKLTTQELNNKQTKEQEKEELERKLKNYIARNRPLVLKNRVIINRDNYQEMVQKLNDIPVSAKIIIDRNKQKNSKPIFKSRNDFERDVDFPEINPNHKGIQVKNFPVASRPSSSLNHPPPPEPCVWAIVQCCPRSSSSAIKDNIVDQRVIDCFEYMACPGVANWNPNLCYGTIANIARTQILKYYTHSS